MRFLMPYQPFSESTAIGHILTKYGRMAGVTVERWAATSLGIARRPDRSKLGTSLKIVGDILGHRGPQDDLRLHPIGHPPNLRNLSLPSPMSKCFKAFGLRVGGILDLQIGLGVRLRLRRLRMADRVLAGGRLRTAMSKDIAHDLKRSSQLDLSGRLAMPKDVAAQRSTGDSGHSSVFG